MAEATELQSRTVELTEQAFTTFAEDIATMFDTTVISQQVDIDTGTVDDLQKAYKKLCTVCSVKAEGALDGTFHVVFDKEGLFTLSGTFVMQPEQIIAQNRKNGTDAEAQEIGDAMGEVGNLLVGAWDRVFREEFEGHGHFVQSGTITGNPWGKAEETIGLTKAESLDILTFELTVEPLPSFRCAALYPASLFESSASEESTEQEEADAAVEASADSVETSESAAEEPQTESSDQPEAVEPASDTAPEQEDQMENSGAEDNEPEPISEAESPSSKDKAPSQTPGPVSEAIAQLTRTQRPLPNQMVEGNYLLNELCAGDIMRTDVVWATPEETIEELIGKMQQHDTGYIMIGSQKKLEGIISKSDVRGALSPYLQSIFIKWRSPMDIATLQIKAKWAMNRPVRTVRPDTTLAVTMHTMSEHGGRCLPVVDEHGTVVGLVTVFDVFHAMLSGGINVVTAGRTSQSPPLV
ncbi:MAG: CBS domain-containing protein [Sedimentisphaerales bacterium]|nr:CBS domain-containing protein [Sedimentisphaerales bacterium]